MPLTPSAGMRSRRRCARRPGRTRRRRSRTAARASRDRRRAVDVPVLEYRSSPASRAAATTRSVDLTCARERRPARRSATSSTPTISPIPRTSPTDGSSSSADDERLQQPLAPARARLDQVVLGQAPQRGVGDRRADAVVRPREPVDEPGPAHGLEHLAEHAANPNGKYPLVEPFPAVSTSGRTSQWSTPNHGRSARTRSSPRRRSGARRAGGTPRRPPASSRRPERPRPAWRRPPARR